jgi:hypothetical protein
MKCKRVVCPVDSGVNTLQQISDARLPRHRPFCIVFADDYRRVARNAGHFFEVRSLDMQKKSVTLLTRLKT